MVYETWMSRNLIYSDMEKLVLSKEKGLGNKRVQGIPFEVTYDPLLRQLAGIIQVTPLSVAYENCR